MAEINCRYFSGYKPCGLSNTCDSKCEHRSLVQTRALIIHLGALGAVVRSTALLAAIRREYKDVHITWVTQKPADQLLQKHPLIDRVLTTDRDDLLALSALQFDVAFCIDKSLTAAGVLSHVFSDKVFGFQADTATGAIVPATAAAEELWQIGLSNHKKFHENTKSETQLVCEALELKYRRDDYVLPLTADEVAEASRRRSQWASSHEVVVGINTGCSGAIPYKKLSVEGHRVLIEKLRLLPNVKIVLLGGQEDRVRNQQIAHGLPVISSSTEQGLRDGLVSVQACDIVATGDSLGMHMGIALKKWTVAWFGPTCAHEIDLYDRGVKILSQAECGPCWKRSCQKAVMCYDLVDLNLVVTAVEKGIPWLTSSFTQPSLATSSSLSPSYVSLNASHPKTASY